MPQQTLREKPSSNPWTREEQQTKVSIVKRGVVYELDRDEIHHLSGKLWAQESPLSRDILEDLFPAVSGMSNYMYVDTPAIDKLFRNITFWSTTQKQPSVSRSLFLTEPSDLEREFEEQLSVWEKETGFLSSITDKIIHPSYLRIIGMGKQVLPLIFERMKKQPGHWFVALSAITGKNPVGEGADFATATQQWIDWGRSQGYTK